VVIDYTVHSFANKFGILVRLAMLALVAIPLLVLAAVGIGAGIGPKGSTLG
jgi:hypothetical protein